MAAEANEAPFTISLEGEVTGEKWFGEFSAKKRLSHKDHLRKDQVRRELLGGQTGEASQRAASTAMILSELAVRLTKSPAWWGANGDGLEFEDDNIIGAVYDAAMKVEKDAAEARKKKAEKEVEKMRAEMAEKKAKEAAEQEG